MGEGGTTINSTVQPLIHFGYQQTVAQAGIIIGPGLVRQSGRTIDEVYQAIRVLFAERRDFISVLGNVSIVAGILRVPTEQGLCVPDHVSLAGLNAIDCCHYIAPLLTTMRRDQVAMRREAVQRLLAIIEGTEEASPLILPTQIVVRKSTGPMPKELD